jgi:hypothetical protein
MGMYTVEPLVAVAERFLEVGCSLISSLETTLKPVVNAEISKRNAKKDHLANSG